MVGTNSLYAPEAYDLKLEVKLRQDAIIFQKHYFFLFIQSPNHFSGRRSGRGSFFNPGAPIMLVCCYQTHRQVASWIW